MGEIQTLIQQLNDPNGQKQADAVKALLELGAPVIDPLIGALDTLNDQGRMRAASVLWGTRDPRALPALIKLSQDRAQSVRHMVAVGLRNFPGDERVIATLQKLAHEDSDPGVRNYAVLSLEIAGGSPTAVEQWIAQLLGNNPVQVKLSAAQKLGQSGDTRAVEPLLRALGQTPDPAFALVVDALGKLRDPRAFEPLVGYLKSNNSYHRALAAQSLGFLGDPRALPLLQSQLTDKSTAWTEDRGPTRTVGDIAAEAIARIRQTPPDSASKTEESDTKASSQTQKKSRWKFW